jgi:Protein of unknown function (DUF3551)
MRVLIASSILVAAALLTANAPAAAQGNAPWCANSRLQGMQDCSFYTLAQCQASAQYGMSECFRNPLADRARARGSQRQR